LNSFQRPRPKARMASRGLKVLQLDSFCDYVRI
jgi:hypothetical protein